MRKFQWFVGQHVFYKRGEVGGIWWGDSGVVYKVEDEWLDVEMEWGRTAIRYRMGSQPWPETYPLKFVLERNARVCREQAAEFMRKARELPRRS